GALDWRPTSHRYEQPGEYTARLTVKATNRKSRELKARVWVAEARENEDLVARAVRGLLPQIEPVVAAAKGRSIVLYNLDEAETQPDDPLLSLVEQELFAWLSGRGVPVLERDKDVVARAVFDRNGHGQFAAKRVISRNMDDASFDIGSLKLGDFQFAGNLSLPL